LLNENPGACHWPVAALSLPTVKFLFTADLHLLRATREPILERLSGWIRQYKPGALVVAGDLSSAAQADEVFECLRGCFPNGPIAVCLGNHDFWLHDSIREAFKTLDDVIEHFWEPAATRHDVALLDVANESFDGIGVVGGYGHYDLGFAVPSLRYEGIDVRETHYLAGKPPIDTLLRWRDFDFMPAQLDLVEVAARQVDRIRSRLVAAGHSRTIVVLHTPPFEAMLGIPRLHERNLDDPLPIYAFFRAYLGNRAMGEMLEGFQDRLLGIVCGHTHRMAGPIEFGGFFGVNIGSDYGNPRGVLYDTASDIWERI
jgi:Icc-related predicted phosphoesterase